MNSTVAVVVGVILGVVLGAASGVVTGLVLGLLVGSPGECPVVIEKNFPHVAKERS